MKLFSVNKFSLIKTVTARILAALLIVLLPCGSASAESIITGNSVIAKIPEIDANSSRTRTDFNGGWTFARFGAMADGSTKTEPPELQAPNFNDSSWRKLDLPHDWGIEGPFRKELPNRTGKLPWAGIGWYRKAFALAASDADKRIFLDIDGAMSHAKVYVNGKEAGAWPYGYASFRIDMTDFVTFGATNLIAIRLDNPKESSRWYPGGGIYRNTWLVKTGQVNFPNGGVFVTTPKVESQNARVQVQYSLENKSGVNGKAIVEGKLYFLGKGGVQTPKLIQAINPTTIKLVNGTVPPSKISFDIESPQLWDTQTPNLYCLVSKITVDGKVTDTLKSVFGIRTVEFTVDNGFLLNGKRVEIKGVCEHHDLGPIGAAFYSRGMERKLEILSEMGCNAIRTAHNMPAPELLSLADRLGFLIVDESFDCWEAGKNPNDYGSLFKKWHKADLREFVRRDRNSPSVIMWSTGNEVREQGKKSGHKVSNHLRDIVKNEDPTRMVTVGCSKPNAGFNGFQNTMDAFGYNYKPHLYGQFREKNPNIPLYGSETASCVSSRGEYFFPFSEDKAGGAFEFQVNSYDFSAPPWASRPDIEFEGQDKNPFVAGEFVWTGFDYIGEPTPYNKDQTNLLNFTDEAQKKKMMELMAKMGGKAPSRSSYFGIMDLCGFKKDRFYIYQARWRPDLPMAHILPHWNWPGRIGKETPVHVYTSGDEAELFLNGKSLGRKKKGQFQYRLRWDKVVYQPGELKVLAYKNGKKWAEKNTATTGKAAAVTLKADRSEISADGYDLSFVTVSIRDNIGNVVPRSHNMVNFEISGPGTILAVGNGNAASHEPFQAHYRKAFNGLCLVVIKSEKGKAGSITLKAKSGELTASHIVIQSEL
ncbi:MAG: DUF4982 domain-containing protein [Planctomycetes bacterium]|nr:DUF4982 domain-containing protein [Planctomycetota bacterium]